MKRSLILLAIAAWGCDREPRSGEGPAAVTPVELPQSSEAVSKPPAVVPLPKDQAEVDRMILAGYTPHADHLHAPGVNSCPLSKGNEAVM